MRDSKKREGEREGEGQTEEREREEEREGEGQSKERERDFQVSLWLSMGAYHSFSLVVIRN